MKRYRNSRKNSLFDFIFGLFFMTAFYFSYKLNDFKKAVIFSLLISLGLLLLITLIKENYKLWNRLQDRKKYFGSGLDLVDKMSGNEFEAFLLAHFEGIGYKGDTTKKSHDFGADLILRKEGELLVVQAKRQNSKVGIKAIQEVVASMKYYNATMGVVVTNNYFTGNACKLAEANNISLWDRDNLIVVMNKNNGRNNAVTVYDKAISENLCPECGGKLKEVYGRYGLFLGCSNYPKCKFTRKTSSLNN